MAGAFHPRGSMLGLAAVLSLAVAPPASSSPATAPVDTMIDVGRVRLHVVLWRGKSGPAVVFQAGGGATLDEWRDVPARVAEATSATVIAYDRAGLGGSDVGPIDLTPEAELEQLDRMLDGLGIHRIVLVGHSYGGLLSIVHAGRRPDLVAGLVLVDPMNAEFITTMGLPWLRSTVPVITAPTMAHDTVVYRMEQTIAELYERGKASERRIGVPAVVITAGVPWWGSPAPEHAWRSSHETLAERASPGELVVATHSRHDVSATDPEAIVAAVERILQRVAGRSR